MKTSRKISTKNSSTLASQSQKSQSGVSTPTPAPQSPSSHFQESSNLQKTPISPIPTFKELDLAMEIFSIATGISISDIKILYTNYASPRHNLHLIAQKIKDFKR